MQFPEQLCTVTDVGIFRGMKTKNLILNKISVDVVRTSKYGSFIRCDAKLGSVKRLIELA
jgi:hypothetical protein